MYRDNITKKPVQDNASTASRKLVFAIVICFIFMTGETIGGYISGSVAILTDAAHLLADVTGFAISLFSIWLGSKGSNPTLSYGFKRAEILGAMLSIIVIWVLTGVLVVEAAHRTGQILGFNRANTADKLTPVVYVDGKIMFIVAVIGLCCNLVLLKLLGHDHGHGGHGHHHGHSHGGHGHGSHDHDEGHGHGSHDHDEGHGHGSHDHDDSHGHGHSQHSPSKISTHNTDYPKVEGSPHPNTDIESNKEQGSRIQVYPHSNTESTPLLASAVVAAAAVGNGDDGQYGSVVQGNKEDHKQKQLKQRKSRFENINISAAYAHAIGDLIQSIGVCIAGALIWAMPGDQYPMVQLADPIATFLFSILVLYSTIVVLQTSVLVLMEAAPADLDLSSIMKDIASIAGVSDVHDLHIWSVTHGDLALTVHVTTDPEVATEIQILRAVQHKLRARGIEHSTIQVEVGSSPICEASQCSEDEENTYSCEGYAFKCADHKCNDLKFV